MRKSTLAVAFLPLLILGCGGSDESTGSDRAPVPASAPSTRATVSFRFDTGTGGSSPVVLSLTSEDAYYKYYEGTWKAQKVRFADGSGASNLSIWNGNLAIASYTFTSYRVSDFGSVTKQSLSAQYSFYDSNVKTQVKYKLAPGTASPL